MIIRPATPDDAAAFNAHVARILAEPVQTSPLAPDEQRTLDETRLLLALPITLLALDGDELVGEINVRRPWARRALAHAATLGMAVRAESRGTGVGSALMAAAIAWAEENGITRIELQVFARNAAAIALYEKFGFVHEGRRRHAVHLDGAYLDDLIMARVR